LETDDELKPSSSGNAQFARKLFLRDKKMELSNRVD
jgi:hypothetical protein